MKHVMERKASDNPYLHRDFHISTDLGLRYVGERMGDNGVKEYLRNFASSYYKPLINCIKDQGLVVLKKHIENIYAIENRSEVLNISFSKNTLKVRIDRCPAISYMKDNGYTPSKWYIETTRTVYETIADQSGYSFELQNYDIETGKANYQFFKGKF